MQGYKLTTWHTQAWRAPRVATIHDVTKKSGRVLPHPSVVFHAYASTDKPWWPEHYPIIHPWSEVRYHPTHRHMKLLSLWGPIKSRMRQYTTQTCSSGSDNRSLTDTGGDYHLGAPTFRSDHSSFFPSSILYFPLIAVPDLILNHSIIYSSFQHSFGEPGYQKALNLTSGVCHSTSTGVLSTKHSITNGFSTMIGSRWYTKGIMHSRVSFNSYNVNAQIK
jgi:hypothetical protein